MLCLCVCVLISSLPAAHADEPTPFWAPEVQGAHALSCDSLLTHKTQLRRASDASFQLTLQLPLGIAFSEARLHYSVNGGAETILRRVPSGTTGLANFPMPAFPNGTVLDYAFDATIQFAPAGSACTGLAIAVFPHAHGFRTKTTSTEDPRTFSEIIGYAHSALHAQPQHASLTDPTPVCALYFLAPTPCDFWTGQIVDVEGSVPDSVDAVRIQVLPPPPEGEAATYDNVCILQGSPFFATRSYPATGNITGAQYAFAEANGYIDSAGTRIGLWLEGRSGPYSGINATHKRDAGFAVSFEGGSFRARVVTEWEAKGQQGALATAHIAQSATAQSKVHIYDYHIVGGAASPFRTIHAFSNPSVESSGGADGAGPGPNPFQDPASHLNKSTLTANDFYFANEVDHEFYLRLQVATSAAASGGSAFARSDVMDTTNKGWHLKLKRMIITANDGSQFSNC